MYESKEAKGKKSLDECKNANTIASIIMETCEGKEERRKAFRWMQKRGDKRSKEETIHFNGAEIKKKEIKQATRICRKKEKEERKDELNKGRTKGAKETSSNPDGSELKGTAEKIEKVPKGKTANCSKEDKERTENENRAAADKWRKVSNAIKERGKDEKKGGRRRAKGK